MPGSRVGRLRPEVLARYDPGDEAIPPGQGPDTMERRDFIKKSSAAAGAIAVGFPGIISGQTVANAL